MFEVPDWGDIPEKKVKFVKKALKEKHKKDSTGTLPLNGNQHGVSKPKFKTKNKLNIDLRKKLTNKVKKSKLNSQKPIIENNKKIIDETASKNVEIKQSNENKTKNKKSHKNKRKALNNNKSLENVETDKLDNMILKEKKKKLFNSKIGDNEENVLFSGNIKETNVTNKTQKKKETIKSMLQKESNRNPVNISKTTPLRARMLERLKAAKFRFLNEKLYTTTGSEAQKLFDSDPTAFQTYHEGYQLQMKKWPIKPLDVIVKRIQKMPKSYKVADMGCGDAQLARRVEQAVRSFDLVEAPGVERCDMTHTPLPSGALDAVVYCLALMGTGLTQCLLEANRVLRTGGHLLIAEVESRFDKVDDFIRDVQKLGFSLKKLDESHKVFFFMEFTKVRDPPAKKGKLPILKLKPCFYKKR